jgi:hypothetical protein
MIPQSSKTPQMRGLSPAAEQACRTMYDEFLKEHGIQSYSLDIEVVPWGLTRIPQQYKLNVLCGDFGVDHHGHESLTNTPEADLNTLLHALMEGQYAYHKVVEENRKWRLARPTDQGE